MPLYTVGIGQWRNGIWEDLKLEMEIAQDKYNIPPTARVVLTAPGSVYAFEVIWSIDD